jgi:hypothetical protein
MLHFAAGTLIAVMLFVMARHWLDPALAAFSTIIWLGLSPFYQQGIVISPTSTVLPGTGRDRHPEVP